MNQAIERFEIMIRIQARNDGSNLMRIKPLVTKIDLIAIGGLGMKGVCRNDRVIVMRGEGVSAARKQQQPAREKPVNAEKSR